MFSLEERTSRRDLNVSARQSGNFRVCSDPTFYYQLFSSLIARVDFADVFVLLGPYSDVCFSHNFVDCLSNRYLFVWRSVSLRFLPLVGATKATVLVDKKKKFQSERGEVIRSRDFERLSPGESVWGGGQSMTDTTVP